MIAGDEEKIGLELVSLRIVWRNPRTHVRASLRQRQASDRYCQWSEQACKIRARRVNLDRLTSGAIE